MVVPAVITACARKPVGKDAAFQVLAKRLPHAGLGGVVVITLPIELAGAGELPPNLKEFDHCWVKQGALGWRVCVFEGRAAASKERCQLGYATRVKIAHS